MALLREVVHESAIVPGHYDETWPSGGSAFAHLTEDDSSPGNEYLWTDKLFQVGLDPPSDGQGVIAYPDGHMWLGAATGTDPTNSALEVFVLGDANDRFALGFDGSLHFGDGATMNWRSVQSAGAFVFGAEASLGHAEPFGPSFWVYPDGSIYAEDDVDGTFAGLLPNGALDLSDGSNDVTMSPGSTAGTMRVSQLHGGGLQLISADGTHYNLIPPNGGGAAAWVAA